MADVKQKKPVNRGVQFAEPYAADDQIETLFNAWRKGGKEELGKALDSLHPEGWASEETPQK